MNKTKDIFKKAKIPFIMSIIIGILNILLMVLSLNSIKEFNMNYLILALFGILPFVISLVFVFLAYKMENKNQLQQKVRINIISIFYIFICGVYIFIWLFVYAINVTMNPEVKLSSYEYSEHFNYFPKEIPDDYIDASYFCQMGALQAGTTKLLYLKLDGKDIENYVNIFKKRDIDKDTNSHRNYKNTPYENKEISDDFVTYVLAADCDDSGWCNHGLDKHVAINETTNEIIFYYENW